MIFSVPVNVFNLKNCKNVSFLLVKKKKKTSVNIRIRLLKKIVYSIKKCQEKMTKVFFFFVDNLKKERKKESVVTRICD